MWLHYRLLPSCINHQMQNVFRISNTNHSLWIYPQLFFGSTRYPRRIIHEQTTVSNNPYRNIFLYHVQQQHQAQLAEYHNHSVNLEYSPTHLDLDIVLFFYQNPQHILKRCPYRQPACIRTLDSNRLTSNW